MSIIKTQSPGVFIGEHELATIGNLNELAEILTQFITGPNNDPAQSGYIPWKYKDDGTLDIDSLFPELISSFLANTGMSISKDGVKVADNIKNISFNGDYITMNVDEDGQLIINVVKPEDGIPDFNSSGIEIITPLKDMILSETSSVFFGDWTPGNTYKGISHLENSNSTTTIEFKTKTKMFAKTNTGQFKVLVCDYNGNPITGETFTSVGVAANTPGYTKLPSIYSNDSPNIYIYISDFTEEENGFSFIPRFKIKMSNIYLNNSDEFRSGRFSVKISFIENGETSTYTSPDIFYNEAKIPAIPYTNSEAVINTTGDAPRFKWCSGVKYLVDGEVVITLSNVENLNYTAAVEKKFDYEITGLNVSGEFVSNNYSLDMNGKSTWKLNIPVEKELTNNATIEGYVVANNGYGSSAPHDLAISLLLDTRTSYQESTDLAEYFNDESRRSLNDFSNEDWSSTADISEYDDGRALMVIPGKGLVYPYGNWASFMPIGSPDYSSASTMLTDRYFSRKFISDNSKLKFGGIFVIEGTKTITDERSFDIDDFKSEKIEMIFSNDNGITWYNLKEIRNSNKAITINNRRQLVTKGVMFDMKEIDRKLFIYWSYPKNVASVNNLWFKLGMTSDSKYCIKSIQLLANDGTEDW